MVVLAVGVGVVWFARFDPNSLKPRIEAAVQQATGRDVGLYGPISVKWSLWPTVQARDVTFANPPGFSRPQMATLEQLDLQLAVLPLLRHEFEVARLVLVHPDILFEVDAQGHANWVIARAPGNAPPAAAPTPSAGSASTGLRSATAINFHDVRIEDGTLGWRDDRTGKADVLALALMTAKSTSADAPLTLAANATYKGIAVDLGGEVGPLARLQQPDAATPWPVKLTLAAAGAVVSVDGALTHPLQGRGYTLALNGTVHDLTAIQPLLPGVRLPPLHDVRLAARFADSGGRVPEVEAATLHLGAADLGAYVAGLRIVSVDIDAPKQDQPVQIRAQASLADTPLTLSATIGAPGEVLTTGQAVAPEPLDISLRVANANFTVKGTVAHPETLSGADLAVGATIPDLSTLSVLAHRTLPAVKQIAFSGHLTDAAGGFHQGATLHGFKLTDLDGDLSGDIGVAAGRPGSLTGKLRADHIDADAVLAAFGRPMPTPTPGGAPTPTGTNGGSGSVTPPPPGTSAASPTASNAKPPAALSPPSPTAANTRTLIPETPIPFGLLRQANADLAVSVDDLKTGGSDYRSIDLHFVLQDGKLDLAPLSADLPEGRLDGSLSVDATAAAPAVAVTLHVPGLEVAPLFAAAGLPGYASGKMEVYADLQGSGATPHAIAAGLNGSLGLAMQNGTIDTALLERLLGPVLHRANLQGLPAHRGPSDLRCFALRADAQMGVATLRTLNLNSSVLSMDGTGSINLGEETLALQLRPQGRLGGTVIVVPMQVTGPIRAPGVRVNAFGAAGANAGTLAGGATPLGLLGGLLGGASCWTAVPSTLAPARWRWPAARPRQQQPRRARRPRRSPPTPARCCMTFCTEGGRVRGFAPETPPRGAAPWNPAKGGALGTLHLERLDGRGPYAWLGFRTSFGNPTTHMVPSRPTSPNGWIAKAMPLLGGGRGAKPPPDGSQGRALALQPSSRMVTP